MAYKPHEHLPLMLFSIFAAPLSVVGLLRLGTAFSYELAAIITMLVGTVAVLGLVQHWRFG